MHYLNYAWYILKHKWFFFVAYLKYGGVSFWQVVKHDLSKFLPSEFIVGANSPLGWKHYGSEMHYNRNGHHWQFWIGRNQVKRKDVSDIVENDGTYTIKMCPVDTLPYRDGSEVNDPTVELKIKLKSLSTYDKGFSKSVAHRVHRCLTSYRPLRMPDKYVNEMFVDWLAAERSYAGSWDIQEWLDKNYHKIVIHQRSRTYLEQLITINGFTVPEPSIADFAVYIGYHHSKKEQK